MNREIKFRAWDANAKEMISSETLCNQAWNVLRSISQPNSGNWIYMQFTGLFDKNGVEIYESDVYLAGEEEGDVRTVHAVLFKDGSFCGKRKTSPDSKAIPLGWYVDESGNEVPDPDFFKYIEIIGNIHENSEKR